ncbi:uncharacterized protein LOC135141960 isoform X2 [Zophobas morio]|uniref:uncharacterized protein LOC135141960 isoform X2 n=1 Tax=Zophobas morio TaxID=2755281 RepID=UPI003083D2A7
MKKNHPRKPSSGRCCRCSCDSPKHVASPKISNIAAERLTLLPGFLSKGVKSLKASPISDHDDSPVNPPKVRRSWRLCKKNQPMTVSGYFHKLIEDKGKSIFREIKEKLREEEPVDEGFERRIFQNLHNFELKDSEFYRKGIEEEVAAINNVLIGEGRNMSNRKRVYNEEDKENYPIKFPYVPPSSWVFQTPPNRKLSYNHVKVDDKGIKPAVIETRNEKKVVYEMNKKINVDLTGFSNNQEINIDKRYMVEVAGSTFTEEEDDKNDSLELENHFLSLTCRPKKVTTALPRFATLKRKRDIFEPQPGCSTDADDYKPNVCFLDSLNLTSLEESFTFKFTSSDNVEGSTTGHLFDYDGNKKNSFNFRF